MKILPIFTLIFLLFLVFSCKDKNCQSIQIGTVDLGAISKQWTAYEEGQKLTFQNEQGEQMIFTNQKIRETYQICIKNICSPIDPYKTKTCEYYAAQGIRNILKADGDLQIELVISTENYGKAKDLIFYDFFTANFSGMGVQERGEYIAHWHSSVSDFEVDQTIQRKPMTELSSIELLGKTYKDVLHTEESANMLYFQKEKGLVVLKMENVVWELVD